LHVIIWNLDSTPEFFALTQKHAIQIAANFGWDKLPGWKNKNGRYDATRASLKITNEMKQYTVNTRTFKETVRCYYDLKTR